MLAVAVLAVAALAAASADSAGQAAASSWPMSSQSQMSGLGFPGKPLHADAALGEPPATAHSNYQDSTSLK